MTDARVEIYAAEWHDERFDMGWGVLNPLYHTFSTDGDVATVACASDDPVGEGWAIKELPRAVSSDEVPVLGVDVLGFTGSGWGVRLGDSSGVWHDITGVQSGTGYREFSIPGGLELVRIALITYGAGSQARFDFIALLRRGRLLLKARSLRIRKRINGAGEFEALCLEPWAEEADLSNIVRIYVAGERVFFGTITGREVERRGPSAIWVRLTGVDMAYHMINEYAPRRSSLTDDGTYHGYAHEVIKDIVRSLVGEGLISDVGVEDSSEIVYLDLRDKEVSILDAIQRACELPKPPNWENEASAEPLVFYIDEKGVLHVFKRGAHERATHFIPIAYRSRQELGDVINSATVLGACYDIRPESGAYEDDMALWGVASGSGTLSQDTGTYYLMSPSLKVELSTDEVVVRLTFEEALDLMPEPQTSILKEFKFFAKWESAGREELTIRCHDGEKGYYEYDGNLLTPTLPWGWGVYEHGQYRPISVKLGTEEPWGPPWRRRRWEKYGNPSWSHITHIDFVIKLGSGGRIWLDQIHISGWRFRGEAEDEESIKAFGRKHITIVDDDIKSRNEAQARADEIVASRAWPDVRLEDITVLGEPGVQPGDTVRLTTMPVPEGCVLFLPLEEGSGDVAYDYGGNGWDGTINSANWVSTPYGRGLEFPDGTASYVDCGDIDELNFGESDFSLEALFKITHQTQVEQVCGKYNNVKDDSGYALFHYKNKLYFRIVDEGGIRSATTSAVVGEWVHAVGVRAGNKAYLYVNGELKATADIGNNVLPNNYRFIVGNNDPPDAKFNLDGQVALVRVYNRALTPEEIRLLYEQVKRRWLTGRYIVSEVEHSITPGEGFRTRITCSKTGEASPGWAELFSNERERTDTAQEVRASESEDVQAPQPRTPASHVEAVKNKFLDTFFTPEGKIKLEELSRYPFTGQDISPEAIDYGHLRPELYKALGGFYEAEDQGGTTGDVVPDDTASRGAARMASSTDEAGVLVEVA